MSSKRGKRARRSSAGQPLPDEMMTEIVLRLPAYSIVRFRAVSRSWAAMLSSPGFQDGYAAMADARRMSMSKFVFFAASPASPRGATAVYSCDVGPVRRITTTTTDLLFNIDRLRPGFLVVSSRPCHGLTLLADTRSFAYWVCNSSTGVFRPLPRRRCHDLSSAGLAFDDRTKEHKVVHLFCHVSRGGESESMTMVARSTRSAPQAARGGQPPEAYRGVSNRNSSVPVLCFSVADEAFSLVAGPAVDGIADYCALDSHSPAVPLHLVELHGSLCMVRDLRHLPHGESCLEIWALRDYSASVWSLDFRVAMTPQVARDMHDPRFITVLGCLGGARGDDVGSVERIKKILIATSQHKVHAYDPATGSIETVVTVPEDFAGGREEAVAGIRIGLYEDSLARVGGESCRQREATAAMTEILLRLPPKSIAMCMLVCRQWRTLIESERFLTSHMLANMERKKVMVVTNGRRRENFFNFMPVETWIGPAAKARSDVLVNRRILCSKPCHGLNLISTSSDDYLCNPCTGSIRCLGIRGKFREIDPTVSIDDDRRHVTRVGRNIGLGFDRLSQEHVVVEMSRFKGDLQLCMIKTSCVDYWSCAGKPPRPVTDMPPAHVDGTLYWISEPQPTARDRVIVAFDISSREFSVLPCQPCCSERDGGDYPLLVELEGSLSLVVANAEENNLQIWTMQEADGTWHKSYSILLDERYPDFSLKTGVVVVPLDAVADSNGGGRILLDTGRALGYYDLETRSIDTLYSLDQLKLPQCQMAFPMLYGDSLVPIQDDEPPDYVAPTLRDDDGGRRCYYQPQHVEISGGEQPAAASCVFRPCEAAGGGCRGMGCVYAGSCCRRVLCRECSLPCVEHTDGFHTAILPFLPRRSATATEMAEDLLLGLPLEHPCVPGPEYCYYYSEGDEVEEGVGRHVFVSLRDLARTRQPRRLIECGNGGEGLGGGGGAAPAMLAPSSLGRRQPYWRPPPATLVRVCHGGRRTAPERPAPSRWMTAPATLAPQKGPFLG
ncbi:hypothetical protein DAI22_04g242000 [Oryza sativa Japonica Group]|nr:hypothetical protein DAI22_04g242000 [Oryza sativa Japonica Group]